MDRRYWVLIFAGVGFLLGILGILAGRQKIPGMDGMLNPDVINRMRYLELDRTALFWYCLRKRGGTALLLLLSVGLGMGGISACLFLFWSGASAGLLLTMLTLRYGIRGLLLFVASVLPQFLLYAPAALLLVFRCMGWQKRQHPSVLLAVVIIGCAMESYVNPTLLRGVLLFF